MQISRTPTPALDLQGVEVRRPGGVEEAVAILRDHGPDAAALAGATWVMRAAQLGRPLAPVQVALAGIPGLAGAAVADHEAVLGALSTHATLAGLSAGGPAFEVVRRAAEASAFPAVRHMATVGGNLATIAFAEADLVPALLAAEATVELHGPGGDERVPVADYLPGRATRPPADLITGARVPLPAGRASTYERLTVRGGGEYAVAAAAVSIDRAPDGTVMAARIAPGSVETTSRLLTGAATALLGTPLNPESIAAAAATAKAEANPRDGLDAPGWYRAHVLEVLVRRALTRILDAEEAVA